MLTREVKGWNVQGAVNFSFLLLDRIDFLKNLERWSINVVVDHLALNFFVRLLQLIHLRLSLNILYLCHAWRLCEFFPFLHQAVVFGQALVQRELVQLWLLKPVWLLSLRGLVLGSNVRRREVHLLELVVFALFEDELAFYLKGVGEVARVERGKGVLFD